VDPNYEPILLEIDENGHESIIVLHKQLGVRYCTVLKFGEDLTSAPAVTQATAAYADPENSPNYASHTMSRMARVGGNYYWDSTGSKIYTKPGV
jgi:hypothetical protein